MIIRVILYSISLVKSSTIQGRVYGPKHESPFFCLCGFFMSLIIMSASFTSVMFFFPWKIKSCNFFFNYITNVPFRSLTHTYKIAFKLSDIISSSLWEWNVAVVRINVVSVYNDNDLSLSLYFSSLNFIPFRP